MNTELRALSDSEIDFVAGAWAPPPAAASHSGGFAFVGVVSANSFSKATPYYAVSAASAEGFGLGVSVHAGSFAVA